MTRLGEPVIGWWCDSIVRLDNNRTGGAVDSYLSDVSVFSSLLQIGQQLRVIMIFSSDSFSH